MGKRRFMIREPALMAVAALRAHKLRSFLTVLGIIIAVSTLIAVVSLVSGLNTYVAQKVANFGANTFYLNRYGIITNAKDYLEARRHNKKFDMNDYEYLRNRLTLAEEVGALNITFESVRGGGQELDTVQIRGVTPNMITIFRETVGNGRYLSEADYDRRALVAFVGIDVVDQLFPNVDPLGQTIRISGLPFEIVGVAEKVGSVLGQSRDNFVNIPLTTYNKLFGEGDPDDSGLRIGVKYSSPAVKEQVMDQARVLMRARRHEDYDEKDRFGIVSSESLTNLWNQIFGGLASMAIGIVSVFLLVGGIVVMNIMLASVTERTREIGIRKSLGARRRDILLQFLVEALVLATVGGIVGVTLALLISQVVQATTSVPMHTPLGAIVLAVGVSTAIGLFFGIYPAHKAARYDPVVALRAE